MELGDKMEDAAPKPKMQLWIKLLILLFVLITSTILYARYVATSGLIVREYLIVDKNLPESFSGMKIVHISDIHYGQTTNKKELTKIVKQVNEYNPDIIVITGDLLDKDKVYTGDEILELENTLKKLRARFGKYIIMGNHDNTQDMYKQIVYNSNLIDLDDTYQTIYYGGMTPILIAGMSTGENRHNQQQEKIADAIIASRELIIPFNILIMHEPDYIDKIEYENFQLILAGHSHGGQVRFPFLGPIKRNLHAKKYNYGHYELGPTNIYVSSGVGTTNFKFRLFNRPSINVYRLVEK